MLELVICHYSGTNKRSNLHFHAKTEAATFPFTVRQHLNLAIGLVQNLFNDVKPHAYSIRVHLNCALEFAKACKQHREFFPFDANA